MQPPYSRELPRADHAALFYGIPGHRACAGAQLKSKGVATNGTGDVLTGHTLGATRSQFSSMARASFETHRPSRSFVREGMHDNRLVNLRVAGTLSKSCAARCSCCRKSKSPRETTKGTSRIVFQWHLFPISMRDTLQSEINTVGFGSLCNRETDSRNISS
jgi:hypothetical protein